MSYAGRSSHSERFPIFDGNDYLYWKERMRIRIQAINYDLWQIVEDGYTIQQPNNPNTDDKANLQLDAQAKDIIYSSLLRNIFFSVPKVKILESKFGMPSTMLMKNLLPDQILTFKCFMLCSLDSEVFVRKVLWNSLID